MSERKDIRCETCAYWSPSTRVPEAGAGETAAYGAMGRTQGYNPHVGQCRRFPPFTAQTAKGPRAQWPMTIASHWCGEHGVIERGAPA